MKRSARSPLRPRVVVLTSRGESAGANAHLDEAERMGVQCVRVASANEAAAEILGAQALVRRVAIAPHVQDYAIRLVLASHPQGEFATDMTNRFVRFGASPRAVRALVLAGKVRAMLDQRYHVSFDDVAGSYMPAMRHRVLLNFEGQAEGVTNDEILDNLLQATPRNLAKSAAAR